MFSTDNLKWIAAVLYFIAVVVLTAIQVFR